VPGKLLIHSLRLIPFSLLTRYDLLYSEESPVILDKVSFDGNMISAGLKARIKIPASSPILSTSSSMSSDLIPAHLHGISVITSGHDQHGPLGPRLMLGPLRFANHDCEPNTQVSNLYNQFLTGKYNSHHLFQFKSVRNSHAYFLWSITDIEEGDPITVKYTEDNSYFPDGCGCKTCNPEAPPEAPRHPVIQENFLKEEGVPEKKRTRRGGRRRDPKRRRKESESSMV
jgi:hypothetical protein